MSAFRYLLPIIALACVLAPAQAVEPRLRLGPSELTAEAFLLNRYVRDGVTRIDSTTLHTAGSVRFLNLGVNLDVYTALDDDDPRGIEALEIDEVRLRFDYLIDVADMDLVTIIPFVEASFYPAKGDARTYNGATANPRLRHSDWEDEPYWVGADAWYKLPYAGMEVGGGLARTGFTNAELGLTITEPTPLEGIYVAAFGAAHVWLDSKSRDLVERDSGLVGGVSISFRPSQIGF